MYYDDDDDDDDDCSSLSSNKMRKAWQDPYFRMLSLLNMVLPL